MPMSDRRTDAMASEPRQIAVIGAGIVGVSTALFLRRAGCDVTLYDGGGAAAGASFGNAGLISVDSCVPGPMPGMLGNVPRWLSDPLGPLSIDPAYLPRLLPWLMRFLRAGTPAKALQSAKALNALHRDAFENYRRLLGPERFNDLFRVGGQIQLWNEVGGEFASPTIRKIWDENDIEVEELGEGELHQLVPGLSTSVKRALFFPRNGNTLNPRRLVETLLKLFEEEGGRFRQQKAMRILPETGGRLRLITNHDDASFSHMVVAAGAWSKALLEPLGTKIALDTERGYHVMIQDPSIELRVPVLDKRNGFGATPLESGIRIAGGVEFAGLEKAPNMKRAEVLLQHARELLPGLDGEKVSMWMGFRPSTPDSLPFIDTAPGFSNIHVACGHGHFGMTAASTTALIVAQRVLGETPQTEVRPYRLNRF
ncbi:FAD-binding oxidoreductase [Afifella sp. IM 167]|uniref:NAD(P)/FAD-dependent oxidoreductase n=1 Tax=Afifella sp. IM 167 TaxID=2033586 RepID=UPI001CCA1274|nr:FAD-binding oxidoreductase [Afifella sp. IM 167]MBZ8131847.1 amino acid dehydrogenase [Afifella sp. IM 167]